MRYEDWFECDTCTYATNSPDYATNHEDENPGHFMIVDYDDFDF